MSVLDSAVNVHPVFGQPTDVSAEPSGGDLVEVMTAIEGRIDYETPWTRRLNLQLTSPLHLTSTDL